jgi:hypothetical protein
MSPVAEVHRTCTDGLTEPRGDQGVSAQIEHKSACEIGAGGNR